MMTFSLRIATWNLGRPGPFGVERDDAIVAKMSEIHADIGTDALAELTWQNLGYCLGRAARPSTAPITG
jgi:hypothetical protein